MRPLGRKLRKQALTLARDKFKECPWHFYDGVRDHSPNALVWGDLAITRVMSSGISGKVIREVMDRFNAGNGNAILRSIPEDYDLVEGAEADEAIYRRIRSLFDILEGDFARTSRVAKILCRKRPRAIPMLDRLVETFISASCKTWRNDKGIMPHWMDENWNRGDISKIERTLHLIRSDAKYHLEDLRDIRQTLSKDTVTQVPPNASLLRIWEAIIYQDQAGD